MKLLFSDSGYWIALLNPQDALHAKALRISRTIRGRHIVTSQMVLTEFMNAYAKLGPQFRRLAVDFVRELHENPNITVVEQTSEQFHTALALYAGREDKAWGLTDCASFLIMREQNITQALAHDIHFRQAGFIPLLRAD